MFNVSLLFLFQLFNSYSIDRLKKIYVEIIDGRKITLKKHKIEKESLRMLKIVPIVSPPTGSFDGKGWQLLIEKSKLLKKVMFFLKKN